jgi:putative RNA 2'-phosphotransferase
LSRDHIQISQFLSFVLRHQPEAIGLALDPEGWAPIDELLAKSEKAGTKLLREDLLQVIESSDKKRFSISEHGQRIRAAQGHSVAVMLGLPPKEPPQVLYHGTAIKSVNVILSQGLTPQSRRQVHLSSDEATAKEGLQNLAF